MTGALGQPGVEKGAQRRQPSRDTVGRRLTCLSLRLCRLRAALASSTELNATIALPLGLPSSLGSSSTPCSPARHDSQSHRAAARHPPVAQHDERADIAQVPSVRHGHIDQRCAGVPVFLCAELWWYRLARGQQERRMPPSRQPSRCMAARGSRPAPRCRLIVNPSVTPSAHTTHGHPPPPAPQSQDPLSVRVRPCCLLQLRNHPQRGPSVTVSHAGPAVRYSRCTTMRRVRVPPCPRERERGGGGAPTHRLHACSGPFLPCRRRRRLCVRSAGMMPTKRRRRHRTP